MDPVTGSLISGGLKLVGGLFGRKKKGMTPQQSIMSTAAGARSAAEKYGFNALTLLQNSNATAGAGMDMGTPPLASLAVLGDIVEDTWGQTGQDKATAREHNKLQNELLRLEVDRARSITPVKYYTPSFGGGSVAEGVGNGAVRADGYSVDARSGSSDQYNWLDPDIRSESDDASRVPMKPLFLGGMPVHPQSGTSDAEAIGSRYGEDFLSPSWFAGWYAFGRDAYKGVKDYTDGFGHEAYRRAREAVRGVDTRIEKERRAVLGGGPFNTRQKFPWEK